MTNPTPPLNERPLDMIIFGGGGDLAARKLLPALYMAHMHCNLPADTRILAIGRKDWPRENYLKNFMEEQARPFIDAKVFDAQSWDKFLALFDYVRVDVENPSDFQRLADSVRPGSQRVFYLSTSPELFVSICDNLDGAGILDSNSRVVLEKPLGHDLAS